MKVARLYRVHDISIEDIPVPEIGPHDALIKTRASGICSGDVMPWYIEKKAPLVPGHEPSGVIVEIGSKVEAFRKGDRVFTHHHAPCMSCRFCMRGDHVQCLTWKRSHIIPGGISEYILIPGINLVHDTLILADTVSFEDATFIEPTACVVKAFSRLDFRPGDTVLIIGLGVMGMINLMLAREYGAGRIIGADMVPFRLRKALEFGADDAIDVSRDDLFKSVESLTGGDMAEIVIVGPNSAEAMLQGISCVRPGGEVLFFTPAKPGETITVDPNKLYFHDVKIVTSYSCGPTDTAEALRLVQKGVVTAERLVTHRFSIEQTAEAFRITSLARDSLKTLITFEQ